jgi:hypothetical protein
MLGTLEHAPIHYLDRGISTIDLCRPRLEPRRHAAPDSSAPIPCVLRTLRAHADVA